MFKDQISLLGVREELGSGFHSSLNSTMVYGTRRLTFVYQNGNFLQYQHYEGID